MKPDSPNRGKYQAVVKVYEMNRRSKARQARKDALRILALLPACMDESTGTGESLKSLVRLAGR